MKPIHFDSLVVAAIAAMLLLIAPSFSQAGDMETFGEKIDKELSEIEEGIKALPDKAETLGGKAKKEWQEQVRQAEKNWEKTKDALARYRESGNDEMMEMRKAVEDALEELREAYRNALERTDG